MARVTNNWAVGLKKTYEKPIRTEFHDTVYFMVFDSHKPSKIGIRADRVPMKTAEWDEKRIGYKLITTQ